MVSGCAWMSDRTTGQGTVTTGSVPACLLGNTEEMTCEPRPWGASCPVYVFETPGGTVVYPGTLKVPKNLRGARIVWHLLEPKASFDTGDGPQGLTSTQFEDGGATNDPEGGGAVSTSGKKYRFVYKNIGAAPPYKYTVRYHNGQGALVQCDPNITNEAN